MLNKNERVESLGVDDLVIVQNPKGYCFTSDATLLAEFVKAKKTDKLIEFGSGSGVISILIQHRFNLKNVFGIEVQQTYAEMSKTSIKQNGKDEFIQIVNDKIQNSLNYFRKASFDIVVCNPPYRKTLTGILAKNEEIAIAKSEVLITLDEIVFYAKQLLKSKGAFYICMEPCRISETFESLKKNNFEVKEMFFSYPNVNSMPSCVFIKGVKDGNAGTKVLPPVITHNLDGSYAASTKSLFSKKE